jgi:hypothetical protein
MAYIAVLGVFTKLQRVTISFAMPVCLRVSARLPLGGFLLSLRSETFMTLCLEKAGLLNWNKNIEHFT